MMTNRSKDLSEVLYALALAMPVPDAKTLDDFVRKYPQHADALTEFAVDLALEPDAEGDEEDDVAAASDEVSPAVSRAISHFQQVSYELEKSSGPGAAEAVANPFASLSRDRFREYAETLGANSVFVMKLRDRQLEPDTVIPRSGFCRLAAEGMGISVDVVIAHLRAQPAMPAHQRFKADEKPSMPKRETFEEAVRNSGLTPEQQRRLLEL
jgi:hypothetical protein